MMLARAAVSAGRQTLLGKTQLSASNGRLVMLCSAYSDKPVTKEELPDTDYNWYLKILDKNPRAEHWRNKYADLRWQYLQDPQVAKGDIVPNIIKDGPERDLVNWPAPKQEELPGRIRMLVFPEEFFKLMYSKTGVTGPYLLVWGALGYCWSQEWLRYDEETHIWFETVILPMFVYHRMIAPRIHYYHEKRKKFQMDALNAFKTAFSTQLELENASERLNFDMVKNARQYKFLAKKEMFQLQWEATYRQRLFEAFEKVKARLDYFSELQACKSRHENKHMVNWIVNSVVASISPEQEKATLTKCIADLKTLSATATLE